MMCPAAAARVRWLPLQGVTTLIIAAARCQPYRRLFARRMLTDPGAEACTDYQFGANKDAASWSWECQSLFRPLASHAGRAS